MQRIDALLATMNYNDIVVLLRVVEDGSFTRAAKVLGVEKSSVSRSIARLESDLGARLVKRTTRALGLTDAGEAFVDRARSAFSGLNEAAEALRKQGSEPHGLVRMTAAADAERTGLAAALASFAKKHPRIIVELSLTSAAVDIVAEGIDLAVRAGRLPDSSLIARRVGVIDVHLFAAPSYFEERKRPRTATDLKEHECVLFRGRGGRANWKLQGPNGDLTVEVRGAISADTLPFIGRVAAAGLGICSLPVLLAREFVQRGELEMVLPSYRLAGAGLYVVWSASAFMPARVALLRDFLVEHLTQELRVAQRACSRAKLATSAAAQRGRATKRISGRH